MIGSASWSTFCLIVVEGASRMNVRGDGVGSEMYSLCTLDECYTLYGGKSVAFEGCHLGRKYSEWTLGDLLQRISKRDRAQLAPPLAFPRLVIPPSHLLPCRLALG